MTLLAVPGVGFVENSVKTHRSDLIVVADWLEASVLFFNKPVSKMDVRDFLCDFNYYQEQTFAMEFVEQVWAEIRRRSQLLGKPYVVRIVADQVEPTAKWKVALGHSFLMMLTCLQRYTQVDHPQLFSASYIQQGDLFEKFSEESLVKHGWSTIRTGWASGIANPAFKDIVRRVAQELNEQWINNDALPFFKDAKEEGLDLVVHIPFADNGVGRAFFLIQCASGSNWNEKLHTPNLEVWTKLIVFVTDPRRGFCFPLALDESEFKAGCVRCSGLFLDRYRLLENGMGLTKNISSALQTELHNWLAPRVSALPTV